MPPAGAKFVLRLRRLLDRAVGADAAATEYARALVADPVRKDPIVLWRSTTARDAAVVGALAPHAAELYALYASSEGKPVSWRYSEVRTLLVQNGTYWS